MNDFTKLHFLAKSSLQMEDGRFSFALHELSISSGACDTTQAAYDEVFAAIRVWALQITPDISVLIGRAQGLQSGLFFRDGGSGVGAPVLRRLLDKFGHHLTNRQLSEAIGLPGVAAGELAIFSNSLAGRGSRYARCMIALALGERPSLIWPFLPENTRTADDAEYGPKCL
jgi:hypothetical protein